MSSALNKRINIIHKEGSITIEKATEDDAGEYTCTLKTESFTFDVFGKKQIAPVFGFQ